MVQRYENNSKQPNDTMLKNVKVTIYNQNGIFYLQFIFFHYVRYFQFITKMIYFAYNLVFYAHTRTLLYII